MTTTRNGIILTRPAFHITHVQAGRHPSHIGRRNSYGWALECTGRTVNTITYVRDDDAPVTCKGCLGKSQQAVDAR